MRSEIFSFVNDERNSIAKVFNMSVIKSPMRKMRRSDLNRLLQNKINSLSFRRDFIGDVRIDPYHTNLFGYLSRSILYPSAAERKRAALNLLKNLWVYEHSKQHTYDIFESFFEFEPMLLRDPEYRDHFFHQVNVFIIGYYIINKLLPNDEFRQALRFSGDINFTWLLASTFHDIGYPIQNTSVWMADFFEQFIGTRSLYQVSLDAMLTQNFYDYVRHLAAYHYAREVGKELPLFGVGTHLIDWRLYDKLLIELKNKNHGVISALLLMHRILTKETVVELDGYLTTTFPREICTAAHAISLHDIEGMNVSFKVNPFSGLLVLCDELQDQGRPSMRPRPVSEITDFDVDLTGDKPLVKCYLQIPDSTTRKKKAELKKRISMNGYLTVRLLDSADDSIITEIT